MKKVLRSGELDFARRLKGVCVHLTLTYGYEKTSQACDNPETLGVCSEKGEDGRKQD